MDRVSGFGPEGCRFESCRGHKLTLFIEGFCVLTEDENPQGGRGTGVPRLGWRPYNKVCLV